MTVEDGEIERFPVGEGSDNASAAPAQMPATGGPSLLVPAGLLALGLGISSVVLLRSRRASQNL